MVGDMIFGPIGAILGGLSSKVNSVSKNKEICKLLKVKITLKSLDNQCFYIDLINSDVLKSSQKYQMMSDLSQRIISIFQIIINNK